MFNTYVYEPQRDNFILQKTNESCFFLISAIDACKALQYNCSKKNCLLVPRDHKMSTIFKRDQSLSGNNDLQVDTYV